MTAPAPPSPAWADACLSAALLAIDPSGLGGVVVRGGPGSVRDDWTALVRGYLPPGAPVRRIPLHIDDDRLLGGLDLAASLAAGRPIIQHGVLAESDGGVVILAMAERIDTATAARLAAALDHGEIALARDGLAAKQSARIGLIALDEGLTPTERPPDALLDRLAFHLDLGPVSGREAPAGAPDPQAVHRARRRLCRVAPADGRIVEALCEAAALLGLKSARASLLALRAARAHAALQGRVRITTEDAAMAARLVLGPRALSRPQDAPEPPEPPTDHGDEAESAPRPDTPDEAESLEGAAGQDDVEMVVAAIQAALPDDLLARVALNGHPRPSAVRTLGGGAAVKSAHRGRSAGWRSGALRSGARLNLIETLRAAAPWQKLRKRSSESARIEVRVSDFRVRNYVQRMESTTIFVVDASGSTALQRLAEAKGAVELLLAKAYVSRSHVALIAFRGAGAETLLPPTRSLARAKDRLAHLPGGGGTPLAAGMDAAQTLALAETARNRTPLLVFLTDGRANIRRDGTPGRAASESDALESARQIREARIAAVFIDTSPRPRPGGDEFAREMGAAYVHLPYLDAGAVLGALDERGVACSR
jgi:magnesium chelatase subunit D